MVMPRTVKTIQEVSDSYQHLFFDRLNRIDDEMDEMVDLAREIVRPFVPENINLDHLSIKDMIKIYKKNK